MSFILDALKKSESERQRKAGPALYEVKLAPPRNKLPWWMITVGALLGINLVFVVWLLLRSPSPAAASASAGAPAATAGSPAQVAAQTAPLPGLATTAPTGSAPATSAPNASAPGATAGSPAPVTGMPPQTSTAAPTLGNPGPAYGSGAEVPPNPALAAQVAAAANSISGAGGAGLSSDDLAPAVEQPQAAPGSGRVRTTTEAGLPSYRDVAATNTRMPVLHLDFHLFAARPQDRFVFINMKKLREGEATPEGVKVESINDEGAVLSFEGSRFTLLHE